MESYNNTPADVLEIDKLWGLKLSEVTNVKEQPPWIINSEVNKLLLTELVD